MKALFIGDVFGEPGVKTAEAYLRETAAGEGFDIVVANAENAAARGTGVSRAAAEALFNAGVGVITLGNHTYKDSDVFQLFKEQDAIIRPLNYPGGNPGKGSAIFYTRCGAVGVVNLLGRLYMDACDCPFAAVEHELAKLREKTCMIIVDIHAEATAEKRAIAFCADGKCSLVAGTHTHVQTADEQVSPAGTAFITDVGMTGPADGVIGVKRDPAIRRFRTMIPERYLPAEGRRQFNAIAVEVDEESGRALSIERISKVYDKGAE